MAKKKGYGQFCPVAKAAEIVAERWTPLILRELIFGSHRFGDLRRGVPLMSPSLLSQRLKELADAGVIERRGEGRTSEYHLTQAGMDLRPVIEMLGLWGHRWVRKRLEREDLDPSLLMWDIRRCVDTSWFPVDKRTVVRFNLAGVPSKSSRWWLVFDRGDADLCLTNPGYDVDLFVSAQIGELVEVWMGYEDLRAALRRGSIRLEGPRNLVRGFKDWFSLSNVARLQARTMAESMAVSA